ncbi:MAG: RNase adaptor protein RapZ, partial [Euzebyales bacterium]|nr:RNase adaptor protein RapZ [Euzebyales bacterium]
MNPQLAVITGLSGAGRTTAAKVLEDLGYFVIDNVPPKLIEPVVELATAPGSTIERVALVVDVRGRRAAVNGADPADDLRKALAAVRVRTGKPRVLFLEAADETLVQRYEAARRAHPLALQDRIVDGIDRERRLLADLRADADLVVDTTDMNVHELRTR